MSVLDFYYAPGACSLVSHIALEEAGLAFDGHAVALMRGDNRHPAFLTMSPLGKVPVLVVDGQPLVETLAIVAWLQRVRPAAGLTPSRDDPFDAARDESLLSWFAATVHPIFTRFRVPPAIVGDPACFGPVVAHAAPALAQSFGVAAAHLADNPWLLGEWSIADAYLYWLWTEAVGAGFDASAFPGLVAHARRVAQRPSVQRALARETAAVADFVARGVSLPPSGPPG